MAVYGYDRTSTKEQHLDRGILEIKKFCQARRIELTDMFTDQQTGRNFERPEYLFLRKRIQPGDTLILTEIDRFGRNKAEILKELQYFEERHVRVMILEIPTTLTDLSGSDDKFAKYVVEMINRLLIELYAIDAEKEVETKKKRQTEGYRAKRLRGEWDDIGRPVAVDFNRFAETYRKVEAGEMRPIECRTLLRISSATYYRYRDRYLKQKRS